MKSNRRVALRITLASGKEDATLTVRMAAIDRVCAHAGDPGRFDALVVEYEALMATW